MTTFVLQTKHTEEGESLLYRPSTHKKGVQFSHDSDFESNGREPNSGWRRMTSPSSSPSSSDDAHSQTTIARRRVFFLYCCASKLPMRCVERVRCPSLLFRPVELYFLLCKWHNSYECTEPHYIRFFLVDSGGPQVVYGCATHRSYTSIALFFFFQRRWMMDEMRINRTFFCLICCLVLGAQYNNNSSKLRK